MNSSPKELLSCTNLDLKFGERTVLDNIDLKVCAGEIVTVIGPNGAGKSSLIKAILGLTRIQAGNIKRMPLLKVGYMPQRLPLDPILPLTVGRLLTVTQRASRSAQLEVLDQTGVAHLINEQVSSLSGGELQRVLLARALIRRPDLLVLDEPTQGVDFAGEAQLYQLIARLRDEQGYGILMVSHDLHLVMAATDRVICLNQHICCAGEPESVQKHPEYLAMFGPRVADNLAVYTHHHDHHHDISGAVVSDSRGDRE